MLGLNSSELFSILLANRLCGIAEIKQPKCFVLKEYNSWLANYIKKKISSGGKKKKPNLKIPVDINLSFPGRNGIIKEFVIAEGNLLLKNT